MQFLERWFGLRAAGTTLGREVGAGVVTYLTLCYILFVQPALMARTGMDPGAVLFATCTVSALGCFLMALWANYPIALAPAMGLNFFFAYTVCGALGFSWQQALAANLCAGVVFLAIAPFGLRERVMDAIPAPLKFAVAAGIGLLIAMLGLQWGGLVAADPVTLVRLGDLGSPVAALTLFGLGATSALLVRRVPGAHLIGILLTAAAGFAASAVLSLDPPLVRLGGLGGALPSPAATAFQLDLPGLFARPVSSFVPVIAVFLLVDLFDTTGTLIGIAQRAGLLVDGRLPRAGGAFTADAAATVAGALLGTSTVTSYVESAAGVAAGGRTGLTAVVTGICMLLSLLGAPLIQAVGAGVTVAPDVVRYPVIAPVLILIGVLMIGVVQEIRWSDPRDAIPAFLAIVIMPFSLSITEGIAWGLISYSFLALVSRRKASPLVHGFALVFLARAIFL